MALTEAQKRAQKKYNEANKDKRDRLRLRNATWRFIKNYATLEDIKEMENMLNERESLLKIIELKELIDNSRRGLPAIAIWENKAEILKTLEATGDEDVNWVEYVADVYSDFEDNEKIIEVEIGNGLPEKFHAHEFEAINEYTN